MNQPNVVLSLDNILSQRKHGAIALSGFRFQLLYSLNRFLDLLNDENPVTSVQFEGIEDVDLEFKVGNTYVQVKSSKNKKGWGDWIREILDRFVETYRAGPSVNFLIVTNFEFSGDMKSFCQFTQSEGKTLPAKLSNHLNEIGSHNNLTKQTIQDFVNCIGFEHTDEQTLIESIRQKITIYFDIHTGNEDLFFHVLFAKVMKYATIRKTCHANDLRKIKFEIEDSISLGLRNPAVEQGWIEVLKFEPEPNENELDYYEGKGARPAHILAELDADRLEWIKSIHDALADKSICIIRSSSGQGKSTLLYRYAHTYFNQHTIFMLKSIQDSDQIAHLRRFLESRLQLGLPIIVLVDDLTERVKLWHELARELIGQSILFLIASREENWFRYAGNLHNLQWKIVRPELSIQEAIEIFRQFEKQSRIASNVESAAWAYDKVSDNKLLIEFVFLITHGQMLSERLEDQITTINRLGEDAAKLHILRLTSLAQVFDVQIPIESLLSYVPFQSDPHLTVQSLIGEYLETTEDGYVDGLHYIRSEHLVRILHDPFPITSSAIELLDLVSHSDLPILARSAFSHAHVRYDSPALLSKLIEKTTGDIAQTLEIVRSLFRADEYRYLKNNRPIIDSFIYTFGTAELVTYFVNRNMPASDDSDLSDAMKAKNLMPEGKLEQMQAMIEQTPRREPSDRFVAPYLKEAIPKLMPATITNDLTAYRKLLIWASFHNLAFDILETLFHRDEWQDLVFEKPINESAEFMYILWQQCRAKYEKFVSMRWSEIVNRYRTETNTLQIIEQGNEIHIEFVVDETRDVHDSQTIKRLKTLMLLLPHYEHYSSQGLYPLTPIDRLSIDDSRKRLPREALNRDIAEINAMYILELEIQVNPDSLYDWLHYWHELRKALLSFVKALIERHESMLRGKGATELEAVRARLSPLIHKTPTIPSRFKVAFNQQCESLNEWRKWTSNFVHTYLNNSTLRKEHLYRHNLFEAWGRIQSMQEAFDHIVNSGTSYFQPTIENENERTSYRYLYDLFDYWVSIPPNRVLQRRVSPNSAVSAWQKSKKRELKNCLKQGFQTLLDNGLKVYLPQDYLEEPPQRNLCFAVEIQDATHMLEYVELLYHCLDNSAVTYSCVYVLPVINVKPAQSFVYSAYSDAVKRIVKGEQESNKISVFQVEIPEGFFDTVRDVDREVLPEMEKLLGCSTDYLSA